MRCTALASSQADGVRCGERPRSAVHWNTSCSCHSLRHALTHHAPLLQGSTQLPALAANSRCCTAVAAGCADCAHFASKYMMVNTMHVAITPDSTSVSCSGRIKAAGARLYRLSKRDSNTHFTDNKFKDKISGAQAQLQARQGPSELPCVSQCLLQPSEHIALAFGQHTAYLHSTVTV